MLSLKYTLNVKVIVASKLGMPFLREKYGFVTTICFLQFAKFRFVHRVPKEGEVLLGNDRFEGYSMDLIDSIAKVLGFKYEFILTPKHDSTVGSLDKNTKKWNGLIKLILDRVG